MGEGRNHFQPGNYTALSFETDLNTFKNMFDCVSFNQVGSRGKELVSLPKKVFNLISVIPLY